MVPDQVVSHCSFSVSSTAAFGLDFVAASGLDFVAIVNQTVTFTSGDRSKEIIVTILSDNIVEANEAFSLRLTTATGSPLTVGIPGTTVITINDDDGMYNHNLFV